MPEIQRCNLASVVLQLMALGISDVLYFDFLDCPPQDAIENALEQLVVLGAVRKGNSGYEVKVTGHYNSDHYSRISCTWTPLGWEKSVLN